MNGLFPRHGTGKWNTGNDNLWWLRKTLGPKETRHAVRGHVTSGRRMGAGVIVPYKLILCSFNIKETSKFNFFLNMKKKYAEVLDEKI